MGREALGDNTMLSAAYFQIYENLAFFPGLWLRTSTYLKRRLVRRHFGKNWFEQRKGVRRCSLRYVNVGSDTWNCRLLKLPLLSENFSNYCQNSICPSTDKYGPIFNYYLEQSIRCLTRKRLPWVGRTKKWLVRVRMGWAFGNKLGLASGRGQQKRQRNRSVSIHGNERQQFGWKQRVCRRHWDKYGGIQTPGWKTDMIRRNVTSLNDQKMAVKLWGKVNRHQIFGSVRDTHRWNAQPWEAVSSLSLQVFGMDRRC